MYEFDAKFVPVSPGSVDTEQFGRCPALRGQAPQHLITLVTLIRRVDTVSDRYGDSSGRDAGVS